MFTALRTQLSGVIADLRTTTDRFDAIERHLERTMADQHRTLEWLREEFTAAKMSLVGLTHDRNQERERLLNVQRDFDWARLRINQLEAERATLLARVLTPQAPMHFAVPTLQPAETDRPEKPDELNAQLRELFGGGALFEDIRGEDDDDADLGAELLVKTINLLAH